MSYRVANMNGSGSRWKPIQANFPKETPGARVVDPAAVPMLLPRAGNDNRGYK